jgi:hypothetical protein
MASFCTSGVETWGSATTVLLRFILGREVLRMGGG